MQGPSIRHTVSLVTPACEPGSIQATESVIGMDSPVYAGE